MAMDVRLSLQVPAGPRAPAAARHALIGLADYVEPHLFDDVRLLVSELVTNSFRHAAADDRSPIDVVVRLERELLRVEVADGGTGFGPRPAGRTAGAQEGSGWGLFLLDRLSSRWGIERNGVTRVWFEIDRVGVRALESDDDDKPGRALTH